MRALLLALLLLTPALGRAAQVRLKEAVDVQGLRDNELIGYGLVVGLQGTGDTEQVLFTSQSISGMLGRLGIRVDPRDVRARNVAAVMVTARLPTFMRPGGRLDVTVGALGNARSLQGGLLLVTPLSGPDSVVYALAQGSLQLGGFSAGANGSLVQKNQLNSGRIPSGATVERAVVPVLGDGPMTLQLKRPDFTNASRIAKAIDAVLGAGAAKAIDPAVVTVTPPADQEGGAVGLLARIEGVLIDVDERAKVVVSERTGTVVAGANVRLRPAAIAQGGLRVDIATAPVISQPGAPFSNAGRTVATSVSQVQAQEQAANLVAVPATVSIDALVKALNALGASPRDLIAILQALSAAGALDAELEVI